MENLVSLVDSLVPLDFFCKSMELLLNTLILGPLSKMRLVKEEIEP